MLRAPEHSNPEHRSGRITPAFSGEDYSPESTASPNLESLRPIGRTAIESLQLSQSLPEVNWGSVEKLVPERLIPKAVELAPYVPALASEIIRHDEPAAPYIAPTAADIKRDNLGARIIYDILNFFSEDWGRQFDSYLVGKATRKIAHAAYHANSIIKVVGDIEKPRDQFIDEIAAYHKQLAQSRRRNRLYGTMWTAYTQRNSLIGKRWYNPKDFPLTGGVLSTIERHPTLALPPKQTLRVVTPEVIKGVEQFLERHGHEVEKSHATTKTSLARKIALRLAGEEIESLPNQVTTALEDTYSALPQNGKSFAEHAYDLCRDIVKLAHQGHTGEEITKALLKGFGKKPQ